LALVVEQLLTPVPGGIGRFTAELGAALAAGGGTHQVTGYCSWVSDTRPAGIPGVGGPVRLPAPHRLLVAAWERGLGPAPRGDVVLAPSLLAPPRGRTPLIVVIHDAVPWTHPETLTPRGVAFHRRIAARVAREADAILVPTAAVRDELARHLPTPAGRVRVLGEGVTSAVVTVPPDADARAARLGLPVGGYLLAVGSVEPRKGLDVAVAALDDLDRDPAGGSPLPLLVAGPSGWGDVDLPARAAESGLAPDRVRLLGRLADPDLSVALSRATALVVPSRSEGFGLPVLEGLAHGIPVITSDAPALVEVGGGVTLVTPVGDSSALAAAVRRVRTDPVLRAQFAAAGPARAAEFSWLAAAERVWTLCEGLSG
jgi:glycosyltransferase involved in cell wall biosynthesis